MKNSQKLLTHAATIAPSLLLHFQYVSATNSAYSSIRTGSFNHIQQSRKEQGCVDIVSSEFCLNRSLVKKFKPSSIATTDFVKTTQKNKAQET